MAIWQQNEAYSSAKRFFFENNNLPVGTAQYGPIDNPWAQMGVTFGMSIFNKVICHYAEGGGGTSSSGGSAGSSKVAEQVKDEIQKILDKYKNQNIENVSDLEMLLESKQEEADASIQTLTTRVAENKGKLNGLTSQYATNAQTLSSITPEALKLQQDNVLNALDSEGKKRLDELVKQLKELIRQQKQLSNEIKTLEGQIQTDETLLKELEAIKKDVDSLNNYVKQLDKLEGKEPIDDYVNANTANITNLIKSLKDAENTIPKDNKKIEQIETNLKNSLQEYVDNGGKNKTILNYAETKFCIKSNS